jgi:hypothetical protein
MDNRLRSFAMTSRSVAGLASACSVIAFVLVTSSASCWAFVLPQQPIHKRATTTAGPSYSDQIKTQQYVLQITSHHRPHDIDATLFASRNTRKNPKHGADSSLVALHATPAVDAIVESITSGGFFMSTAAPATLALIAALAASGQLLTNRDSIVKEVVRIEADLSNQRVRAYAQGQKANVSNYSHDDDVRVLCGHLLCCCKQLDLMGSRFLSFIGVNNRCLCCLPTVGFLWSRRSGGGLGCQ